MLGLFFVGYFQRCNTAKKNFVHSWSDDTFPVLLILKLTLLFYLLIYIYIEKRYNLSHTFSVIQTMLHNSVVVLYKQCLLTYYLGDTWGNVPAS